MEGFEGSAAGVVASRGSAEAQGQGQVTQEVAEDKECGQEAAERNSKFKRLVILAYSLHVRQSQHF